MCARLGVGPPPLPLKGLTAGALAGALQQLLDNPHHARAAQAAAAALTQEDGLEGALLSIRQTLLLARR